MLRKEDISYLKCYLFIVYFTPKANENSKHKGDIPLPVFPEIMSGNV